MADDTLSVLEISAGVVFLASSIYFYKHWIERMCADEYDEWQMGWDRHLPPMGLEY